MNPEWENGVQKAHGQESFDGIGQEQSVDLQVGVSVRCIPSHQIIQTLCLGSRKNVRKSQLLHANLWGSFWECGSLGLVLRVFSIDKGGVWGSHRFLN